MRLLLLIIFFNIALKGKTQFFSPSIEPFVGLNFFHLAQNDEGIYDNKGLASLIGVKGYLNFGDRISLGTAIGYRESIFGSWKYEGISAQASLLINWIIRHQTGFSFFTESAFENCTNGNFSLPIYLGTNQKLSKNISMSFRLRLPCFFDTHYWKTSDYIETGIEIGFKFRIIKVRPVPPIKRFGNPFILI